MKNKITVEFSTKNWESELLRKGVLFEVSGQSLDILEEDEDLIVIRSYEYFGSYRVAMEVKKWTILALQNCRMISKIICEGVIYTRGAGRFVENDVPGYVAKKLYEVLA